MSPHRIIMAFLLIILVSACTPIEREGVVVEIGDRTWVAEVAQTPEEHEIGLMNRDFMPENQGMLFIFPDERVRTFWMKNTSIPLDIIFISRNWRVVSIAANATPCIEDPCTLYPSERAAQYVLEVNAGQAALKNVRAGQLVQTSLN